jgi:hypothetical protein
MLEGRQVLIFDTGRFFVVHPADGYKSGGHFEVSGNRVRIFNDPNCTATTGLYRYRLTASTLAFEVVSDPCPYEGLRRRYLTALRWHESSYAAGAEG